MFLAYHHDDLQRALTTIPPLAAFVSRRGLLRAPELAASCGGAAVAALIVLAWYGIGHLVARGVAPAGADKGSDVLSEARAIAHGAGFWSLLWYGLGMAGLYTTGSAVAAVAVGVVLGVWALARRRSQAAHRPDPEHAWNVAGTVAGLMTAMALTVAFTAALAPPTAKDTLIYHMALPKGFAAARALITDPNNIASYFPLGVEMQGLSAMLAGRAVSPRVGEAAFGATVYAFFPLLLAIVYGWARRLGLQRPWSLLAVALVACVPTAYDVAANAYVDVALAVYVALALEATAQWWRSGDRRYLVDVAVAMGCALAVKLLALFTLLVVAALLLLRVLVHRDDDAPDRSAGYAVAALAGAVALATPWYGRTWANTGSPVFPFLMNVWPAHADGWDAERSTLWQMSLAQYGAPDPLVRLLTPLLVSLTGSREIPQLYEGVLGPAFLVGLVLVAWAWRRGRLRTELAVAAAGSVAIFLCWAFSSQLLRYVVPALAPLAVATAGAAAALSQTGVRGLRLGLLTPAAAGLVLTLSWFVGDAPMLPVVGTEARAEYLARRLDYYPYYRLVNETLPADACVWLVDMRRDTYHLERSHFADYFFEDYTLRRWVDAAKTPDELWARARAAGITHVLARHDILLAYDRSVLVDDARSREENLGRLKLARAFLAEGATVIRADAKFVLAKLPAGSAVGHCWSPTSASRRGG